MVLNLKDVPLILYCISSIKGGEQIVFTYYAKTTPPIKAALNTTKNAVPIFYIVSDKDKIGENILKDVEFYRQNPHEFYKSVASFKNEDGEPIK